HGDRKKYIIFFLLSLLIETKTTTLLIYPLVAQNISKRYKQSKAGTILCQIVMVVLLNTRRRLLLLLLLAAFSLRLCFGEDRITLSTPIKDSETLLCKSVPVAPNAIWVQLMDTGNLMLQDNRNNGETLWESFKHPYNSFLPRMTLGTNNRTGENLKLTSWTSSVDPSTGNFTAGLAPFTFPELLIWRNSVPIWRSGPWNGQVFIGLPDVESLLFLDGFNLNNDNQGTFLMSYANDSFMYHFNLDPNGAIYQRDWSTSMNAWRIGVRFPSTACDTYGMCGPYGSCSSREDPPCSCVKGFVPRNSTEWNARNWTNGCVRRAPLRCERQSNASSNGGGGKEDGFFKMQKMKVPINAEQSLANEQACPKVCSDNCSCTAYAYDRGIGCMIWSGSLLDMQSFLGSGIELYVRLAHSELKTHSKRAVMITAPVLGVAFIAAVCVLLACRKFKKRPEAPAKDQSAELLFKRMEALTSGNESASNQVKLKELPLFEFQVLATSTDSFSLRNKLGQGGFGPVYKAWKLWNEGEAASLADPIVFDECFEKEITKCVQIGLLCVQEVANDRPNVSTVIWMLTTENTNIPEPKQPAFIARRGVSEAESSDQSSQKASINDVSLTAVTGQTHSKRAVMITAPVLGVALVAAVCVLLACRKFKKRPEAAAKDQSAEVLFKKMEALTNGNDGYMSPEYAMDGIFSEKSDVFSLGVIFLEIISGKRNSHKEENNLSLLAYKLNLKEKEKKKTTHVLEKPQGKSSKEKKLSKAGTILFQIVMVVLLNTHHRFVLLLLAAFSCFSLRLCFGEDRITFSTPIKDSETLLCKSGIFRFGFFTPVNSTARLRYVGIWYDKVPIQTVVWVANKDTPINDTFGVISISDDGNLVVTDGRKRLLWSTNVTVPVAPNATWVQLMDTGNLRLENKRNKGEILWESFKHPYNSMLPRMNLRTDRRTGENLGLTSWKSYVDPSAGNYTVGLASFPFPELLVWKNNVPKWRSGPWNGQVFIGLPDMDSLLNIDGFNIFNDNQGTVSLTYANDSFMYHFNLDPDGVIYQRDWSTSMNAWRVGARFPSTDCDAYSRCGPYGSCHTREDPPCSCVKGFVPRNNTEWSGGNWTNGCVRRAPLRCERQSNVSSNGGGKRDGFFKLQKMKLPINAVQSLANEQACPKVCLDNCSCTAYAYDGGIGCMLWSGSLVDMQSFLGSGIDLYVRLAHSEIKTHNKRAVMITAPVLGVAFVAAVCVLLACRKFKKRPEAAAKDQSAELFGYMSPEYAMDGIFSEKSDVFSLGVIFLEIISGKRNSHKEENNLNLLAYAWKLWNE
ncbi:unnamed protein product, partial [Thlaspi arvense]